MNNRTLCRNAMLSAAITAAIAAVSLPAQARVPGKDGAFTVSAANTTVNTTTTLTAGATQVRPPLRWAAPLASPLATC